MKLKIQLLIILAFCLTPCLAQSSTTNSSFTFNDELTPALLKQKYGSPDAKGRYIVRPDIGLSVKYKQDQNPSEMNIMPLEVDVEDDSKSSDEVMPSDVAEEVLDELVPVAERGEKVSSATISFGCPFSILTEYERLTIMIGKRCERRGGGTYSISVRWKR